MAKEVEKLLRDNEKVFGYLEVLTKVAENHAGKPETPVVVGCFCRLAVCRLPRRSFWFAVLLRREKIWRASAALGSIQLTTALRLVTSE